MTSRKGPGMIPQHAAGLSSSARNRRDRNGREWWPIVAQAHVSASDQNHNYRHDEEHQEQKKTMREIVMEARETTITKEIVENWMRYRRKKSAFVSLPS